MDMRDMLTARLNEMRYCAMMRSLRDPATVGFHRAPVMAPPRAVQRPKRKCDE